MTLLRSVAKTLGATIGTDMLARADVLCAKPIDIIRSLASRGLDALDRCARAMRELRWRYLAWGLEWVRLTKIRPDLERIARRRAPLHLREDAIQEATIGALLALRKGAADDWKRYARSGAKYALMRWAATQRRHGVKRAPKNLAGVDHWLLPERRYDDSSVPEPMATKQSRDTWRAANETQDLANAAIDAGRRPRDIGIDLRPLLVATAPRLSPVFAACPTWLVSELPPTPQWCRSPEDIERQYRPPITPLRAEQRAIWKKRRTDTISDSEMPARGLLIGRGSRSRPLFLAPRYEGVGGCHHEA